MNKLIKELKIWLEIMKDKEARRFIFKSIFLIIAILFIFMSNFLIEMPYHRWLLRNLPVWLAIVDLSVLGTCFILFALPLRQLTFDYALGVAILSAIFLKPSFIKAPTASKIIFYVLVFLYLPISYYFRRMEKTGKLKLKIKDEEPKTPYERAIFYFEKGEFEKAIQEVEGLLVKDPKDWGLYSLLGICWLYLGKHDLAIVNYKKAMEINPEELEDRQSLAHAYTYSGRSHEEGIKLIEEILRIFSSEKGLKDLIPFAQLSLAWVYYKKGDIHLAIQYFDEALPEIIKSYKKGVPEIDPWMAEDHYQMGILYSAKGMKEEALKEFEKSIQCSPKSWFAKESEKMRAEIKNSLQNG